MCWLLQWLLVNCKKKQASSSQLGPSESHAVLDESHAVLLREDLPVCTNNPNLEEACLLHNAQAKGSEHIGEAGEHLGSKPRPRLAHLWSHVTLHLPEPWAWLTALLLRS